MMTSETPYSIATQTRKHFQDLDFNQHMIKHIRSYLPGSNQQIIIVCIGTDRCTGDALGPFVGTYLSKLKLNHMNVYGTVHSPVHAKNLKETIDTIYSTYKNPFIIAIDASLGKASSIGSILVGKGSLQPGAALQKELPNVGDIYIAGIVNISGFMEFQILQNTRLSIVMDMAHKIAKLLFTLDRYLTERKRVI